jgi:hypothetical protein
LQLQQVGSSVITIESGIPVLPGVASSCGLSSVPEDSVSMLAALSAAKKFRVSTAFGVVLTVAGAAVTTGFFEVRAASLLLCLLFLRTSWRPSS